MAFSITATNPKGLDFDYYAEFQDQARDYIRAILARGGVDLKMNGKLIPENVIVALSN